jgi:hypothetical protein
MCYQRVDNRDLVNVGFPHVYATYYRMVAIR